MKVLKVGAVVLGAVIITALGIDAADTFQGSNSTLLGQIIATETSECPKGMTAMANAVSFSCVDMFEASASEECPVADPKSAVDTVQNMKSQTCSVLSKKQVNPWRYISRENAQLACARAGKRLPTAAEWYMFALGTPDDKKVCNSSSGEIDATGEYESCISAAGVLDAVGNVWEWTTDDIFDATYGNRPLPEEGYVTQVDSGGVATVSGAASDAYGKDYLWTKKEGVFAMTRGGFYGSGDDAGVYTVHAAMDPNIAGAAIGFRCVK